MTTATTIGTAMAHHGKGSGVEKTYMETTLGFVSTTRVYKREGYSVGVHVCVSVCACVHVAQSYQSWVRNWVFNITAAVNYKVCFKA